PAPQRRVLWQNIVHAANRLNVVHRLNSIKNGKPAGGGLGVMAIRPELATAPALLVSCFLQRYGCCGSTLPSAAIAISATSPLSCPSQVTFSPSIRKSTALERPSNSRKGACAW